MVTLVALLGAGLFGCHSMKRSQTFTGYPAGSLPGLPLTQNPVPVEPSFHLHGPTNTIAFGQQYRPTLVLDPRSRTDQRVLQTTVTTTDTKYPQLNP